MARSWPERLAKRIGRLSQNLDMIEAKGMTGGKAYNRMLEELADLCGQILDARDKAQAELSQAKTDAIFLRRKMSEAQSTLQAEQEAFQQEAQEARRKRKAAEAEAVRVQSEMAQERAGLQEATDRAKEAERKFTAFMDQMKKASAKL